MNGGQVDARQRLAREPVLLTWSRACLVGRHGVFEFVACFLVGSVDIGERGAGVAHVAGQRDRELTAVSER